MPKNKKTYELISFKEFFEATTTGKKTYEFRKNIPELDEIEIGDTIVLIETDPDTNTPTGRRINVQVTFISKGKPWLNDTVIFSFKLKKRFWFF